MPLVPTEKATSSANRLKSEYTQIVDGLRRGGDLRILDVGTGLKGLSRVCMEAAINGTRDRLILWDPYSTIAPSRNPHVEMIQHESELPHDDDVDIVNIAYVLCCMDDQGANDLLSDLQVRFPSALLVVAEYIMSGRKRTEALEFFSGEKEQACLQRMGETPFLQSHMRFSSQKLTCELQKNGWNTQRSTFLGEGKMLSVAERRG